MKYVTIDIESVPFASGRKAPPPVCLSIDWDRGYQSLHAFGVKGTIFRGADGTLSLDADGPSAEDAYAAIPPDAFVVGHTLSYDHTCMLAHCPELRELIWWRYNSGKVLDLWLAWRLLLNAQGRLQDKNPPPGDVAALCARFLDREVEGKNDDPDGVRMTFGQFAGVPVWDYSPEHRDYSLNDALEEGLLVGPLTGAWRKEWPQVQDLEDVPDLIARGKWMFETTGLLDAWGFRTEGEHVAKLREASQQAVEAGKAELVELGLYRTDGTKNQHKTHRMVEHAYGARAVKEAGHGEGVVASLKRGVTKFEEWLDEFLASIPKGKERTAAKNAEWERFRALPNAATGDRAQWQEMWKSYHGYYKSQGMSDGEARVKAAEAADQAQPSEPDPPFPGGEQFAALPWRTYFSAVPRAQKGGISTSKETLAAIDDPYVNAYAGYQADEKLLNSFIPKLEWAADKPFHPWTDPLKSTGRTSAKEMPYQQMPKKEGVRESFVARPGYLLCASDISIAELRCLAQLLLWTYGRSQMARLIQEGKDLHLATAAALAGVSYEEAVRRHDADDPDISEKRQLSKALNFGLPGGLGAASFRDYAKGYGVILTLAESKQLKQWWLNQYPEMRWYLDDIGTMCSRSYGAHVAQYNRIMRQDNPRPQDRWKATWMQRWPRITDTGEGRVRYVQPVSGRVRLIEGGRAYAQTANTGFQGLNGDVTLAAGYQIQQECFRQKLSSPLYGARSLAIIHDEVVAEVPIHNAAAAAHRIRDIIVEVMESYLPDIPAKADAALMRRWSKKAKPVYSDTGILIPWEDAA
jgi:DNA polymerase-1